MRIILIPTPTIIDSWYEWSQNGFNNLNAVRFPKGKGAKPLFSLWHGEKLNYIEARKKIYAPFIRCCSATRDLCRK